MSFGASTLPGTYTRVNAGALGTVQSGGGATPALVGSAADGQPKTPLSVANPAQLALLFNSGPLVDAGNAAFAEGAPQLVCCRVDPATQASYTFLDASSNPSLVVTATSWGSLGNQVQAQILTGTAGGTLDFYAQFLPSGYKITSPDLGQAFTLQYTGNGTSPNVTVSNQLAAPTQTSGSTATTGGTIPASTEVYLVVTAVNASGETIGSNAENVTTGSGTATNTVTANWDAVTGATRYNIYASTASGGETFQRQVVGGSTVTATLTSVATGGAAVPGTNSTGKNLSTAFSAAPSDGSAALDVPLNGANGTSYTTLAQLVAYLAGQAGYVPLIVGNGSIPTSTLDAVTAESISSAYTLTAKLGALVQWINTYASYLTAAAASGAVNAPATTSLVSLAGGSNGTAAQSDWNAAIDALSTQDIQTVTPLSGTAATIAYCEADIASWIANSQCYPQGFYGLAWGATDTQLLQQAASLNTGDAELCGPGWVGPNSAGVTTNFDGFYMAARLAGLACGQPSAATPITNKTVHVSQLERNLTVAEQTLLLGGGVTAVIPQRKGGFKVLEDVTTSISSTTIYDTQGSIRRSINLVRDHLQTNLDADIGLVGTAQAVQQALIQRATASLTADLAAGNIAGFSPVTNVTQSPTNSTAWLVDTDVTVVDIVDQIFCTVNLSTGSVTTSSTS